MGPGNDLGFEMDLEDLEMTWDLVKKLKMTWDFENVVDLSKNWEKR